MQNHNMLNIKYLRNYQMRILPVTCLAQGEELWMRGQQFVKSREKTANGREKKTGSREKIIALLSEDGALTMAALARRIGITPNAGASGSAVPSGEKCSNVVATVTVILSIISAHSQAEQSHYIRCCFCVKLLYLQSHARKRMADILVKVFSHCPSKEIWQFQWM